MAGVLATAAEEAVPGRFRVWATSRQTAAFSGRTLQIEQAVFRPQIEYVSGTRRDAVPHVARIEPLRSPSDRAIVAVA